jgi:hypothetical protein
MSPLLGLARPNSGLVSNDLTDPPARAGVSLVIFGQLALQVARPKPLTAPVLVGHSPGMKQQASGDQRRAPQGLRRTNSQAVRQI